MPNSFHLEGVEAFDKHEYQTAKSLFLQAIEQNPEEADSYLFLGKSYFFCDEKSEAVVHLKKYIEFNQHNSEEVANVSYAFDILGQCYEAENKDSAAITCYTTATKINPSAASAWHNLGLFYIKSAQYYLEQDLTNSFKMFRGALCISAPFDRRFRKHSITNFGFIRSVISVHSITDFGSFDHFLSTHEV